MQVLLAVLLWVLAWWLLTDSDNPERIDGRPGTPDVSRRIDRKPLLPCPVARHRRTANTSARSRREGLWAGKVCRRTR
jgi:hypothetical protein